MRSAICFSLSLCFVVTALGADDAPDSSSMLKVPAAEARPAGDDAAAAQETPTPAAEEMPATSDTEQSTAPGDIPAENGVVAEAFPLSRYEALWERSPFQLESAAPPVESAGLSQRFALTGLAAINGEPIAFLMDRATQNRLMVRKDGSEGGVSLVQVDVQKKYSDSTATVRQGAEVGVIRFDASASAAPPAMQVPPVAPPMVRAMPPQVAPGQPPAPVPQAPGVVPPVPGPGVPQTGQVQGDPGQMPPPRVIRRRALIPAAP